MRFELEDRLHLQHEHRLAGLRKLRRRASVYEQTNRIGDHSLGTAPPNRCAAALPRLRQEVLLRSAFARRTADCALRNAWTRTSQPCTRGSIGSVGTCYSQIGRRWVCTQRLRHAYVHRCRPMASLQQTGGSRQTLRFWKSKIERNTNAFASPCCTVSARHWTVLAYSLGRCCCKQKRAVCSRVPTERTAGYSSDSV